MNSMITPAIQPVESKSVISRDSQCSRYFARTTSSVDISSHCNESIAAQLHCLRNDSTLCSSQYPQTSSTHTSHTMTSFFHSNNTLPVTMNGERVKFSRMNHEEILSIRKAGSLEVEVLSPDLSMYHQGKHKNVTTVSRGHTIVRQKDVLQPMKVTNEGVVNDTHGLTIKNQSTSIVKKRKKRPKKPPLKVSSELPTMIPALIDPNEKQHQCPDCPRKFSWSFQLQQHRRTHSGERPFICEHCQQAYKRREHLQRHERVHSGERPFECDECGKKYRRKTQLIRHARVHTGERPYSCNICNKSFRRRGHLSRHFKTHANEILKKSGINPESLEEASALMSVPFDNKNVKNR
uniref:zinc finger protein with KRAB and SCAN domains 7-like n=1 Tax=Styela clava TaxID=7725 RepID=UPI00193AA7DE|nr:zinc finger protein with KRAB and SCAN domains 7-like [Styela clava]